VMDQGVRTRDNVYVHMHALQSTPCSWSNAYHARWNSNVGGNAYHARWNSNVGGCESVMQSNRALLSHRKRMALADVARKSRSATGGSARDMNYVVPATYGSHVAQATAEHHAVPVWLW
jgi:hypothetical protein